MAGLDAIVIFIVIALFNNIKAYLFDEEFSKVVGINVKLMEYVVFILIAFSVVVLIRVVGIILIIALLTALLTVPPAISKLFTFNLKKIMLLSILFGVVFSLLGLYISYKLRIASGASIIIVAVNTYVIFFMTTKFIKNKVKLNIM